MPGFWGLLSCIFCLFLNKLHLKNRIKKDTHHLKNICIYLIDPRFIYEILEEISTFIEYKGHIIYNSTKLNTYKHFEHFDQWLSIRLPTAFHSFFSSQQRHWWHWTWNWTLLAQKAKCPPSRRMSATFWPKPDTWDIHY